MHTLLFMVLGTQPPGLCTGLGLAQLYLNLVVAQRVLRPTTLLSWAPQLMELQVSTNRPGQLTLILILLFL